jgi:hypothetical protein
MTPSESIEFHRVVLRHREHPTGFLFVVGRLLLDVDFKPSGMIQIQIVFEFHIIKGENRD